MFRHSALALVPAAIILAACVEEPARVWNLSSPTDGKYESDQVSATNIQDWDYMAAQIADGLQQYQLLPGPATAGVGDALVYQSLYVNPEQSSAFIRLLADALRSEVTRRGGTLAAGPAGAIPIDLRADIIIWGSRLKDDPDRVRAEGVWTATFRSRRQTAVILRKPFYIHAADVALYLDVPPSSDTVARPLRYAEH